MYNDQCLPQCNNQQCQSNSFCQQGVCLCTPGYSYTNGQCTSSSSCSPQCSPNGVCNNGVCSCNTVGPFLSSSICFPRASSTLKASVPHSASPIPNVPRIRLVNRALVSATPLVAIQDENKRRFRATPTLRDSARLNASPTPSVIQIHRVNRESAPVTL